MLVGLMHRPTRLIKLFSKVSSTQVRPSRGAFGNWTTIHPLCQRDPPCKVCHEGPSAPRFLTIARFVIANDLSPSATSAMKRNVEINKLGPTEEEIMTSDGQWTVRLNPGKVRVHEDDAWYAHSFRFRA